MSSPESHPPKPLGARVLASLNSGSLGVAVGFGVTAAILFSPIFRTSFIELLGRTLFLAMVLLLVFVATQRCPDRWLPHWLPRWLFTTLAVALAAPLATLVIYLIAVGGDVSALLRSEPRMTGLVILSGTALILGLVITLSAQLREREARARSQALQFELERSRLERQALDAQLALLQAQIEPHFLFNTLANVQALVESNSPRAAEVLKSLTAYLRAAMPRLHDAQPTVASELALVRAYLDLMQMRMPDRLAWQVDVDAAMLGLSLPPMLLLTLVENAVRHGLDPSEEGGRIDVGGSSDGSTRRLWVADTGGGMSEHAQPGMGLTNLRARLAATFGPAARLQMSAVEPHGLRAEISWPR